jgi:hypothetical protein
MVPRSVRFLNRDFQSLIAMLAGEPEGQRRVYGSLWRGKYPERLSGPPDGIGGGGPDRFYDATWIPAASLRGLVSNLEGLSVVYCRVLQGAVGWCMGRR